MSDRSRKNSQKLRKPDHPWRDRWIVTKLVAVLVGQRPWSGSTAVELLTWCPSCWTFGHDWTCLKGELELSAYMKKREKKNAGATFRAAVDEQFATDYPTLYDYLTATCYDDDRSQPRVVSTLLIFGQDGCWKACLRDRTEGCCCWCAAPSVLELLGVLDRELADGTAVWREDRLSGAPEARRKPRQQSS